MPLKNSNIQLRESELFIQFVRGLIFLTSFEVVWLYMFQFVNICEVGAKKNYSQRWKSCQNLLEILEWSVKTKSLEKMTSQ